MSETVGYKLYDICDSPEEFPLAVEVALPEPNQPVNR